MGFNFGLLSDFVCLTSDADDFTGWDKSQVMEPGIWISEF